MSINPYQPSDHVNPGTGRQLNWLGKSGVLALTFSCVALVGYFGLRKKPSDTINAPLPFSAASGFTQISTFERSDVSLDLEAFEQMNYD